MAGHHPIRGTNTLAAGALGVELPRAPELGRPECYKMNYIPTQELWQAGPASH